MKIYAPLPAFMCILLGFGTIFVGLLMRKHLPELIMSIIKLKLAVNRYSETLPIWRDVPIEIYTSFYLFNYTNADDFMRNWKSGVKPKVEQVGPYTYRQFRKKTILKWDDDDDSLEYTEIRRYHFVPHKSGGSESDRIILPNIPLMAIVQLAPEADKEAVKPSMDMTNATAFAEHSVAELLFYGYKDELVEFIQDMTGEEILPGAIFGLLYGKNGSHEGVLRMKRGNHDNMEIGQITHWNNASVLTGWNGMPCTKLHGTDGSLNHASIQKEERLILFNVDLSRTLYLSYNRESEFRGIHAYRFTTDLSLLADVNMNPDNICYCMDEIDKCNDAGVMSLAPVKQGAPVFMSHPHFLMANHKTRFAIDGLDPNPDLHQLYIDIEPISGAPMKVAGRFQMNVQMKPREGIEEIEDWPEILLPILWIEENAQLTERLKEMISWKMGLATIAGAALPWLTMIIGMGMISLGSGIALLLAVKSRSSRVLPLMPGEDPYVKPNRGLIQTLGLSEYFGNGYNE